MLTSKHVLAVAAVAVVAGACGGSSAGTSVTAPHTASTIRLGEAANGRTVTAQVGDTIVVTLHSTYWTLATPGGAAVVGSGPPSPSPGGAGCPQIPGTGCGTVTATYRADAAGTSTLSAHRESCGEAMRCAGSQSRWKVTVRVG